MKEIILENVCRSYRVPVKEKSFAGYLFRRRYRLLEAVKDISFSIGAGETVGLVGPNGAGKSTTIKMLTGGLRQTPERCGCSGGILLRKERKTPDRSASCSGREVSCGGICLRRIPFRY